MKKLLIVLFFVSILLTACAEAVQMPPVDRKTPLYESAQDYLNRTNAEKEAIEIVSNQFGVEPSSILLLKTSAKTWLDTCLELSNVDEICSPINVPGYLILLYAESNVFEAHTDKSAQNVRVINYLSQYSSPIEVALQYLTKKLGVPVNTIGVLSSEQVDWQDSCLGVSSDGSVCAPVITPGYLIQMEAEGTRYEFHTDIYGSRLILVDGNG